MKGLSFNGARTAGRTRLAATAHRDKFKRKHPAWQLPRCSAARERYKQRKRWVGSAITVPDYIITCPNIGPVRPCADMAQGHPSDGFEAACSGKSLLFYLVISNLEIYIMSWNFGTAPYFPENRREQTTPYTVSDTIAQLTLGCFEFLLFIDSHYCDEVFWYRQVSITIH